MLRARRERERVEQVDFALGAFAFPQIALRLENRSLGQDFPVRALNGCKSAYPMRSASLRRLTPFGPKEFGFLIK